MAAEVGDAVKVDWTGHPFVDAGLAAIAAIAEVQSLDKLTPKHLEKAAGELERILLNEQVLKTFSGQKKTLRLVFPNSELDNPSNWSRGEQGAKSYFRDNLRQNYKQAALCSGSSGNEVCHICGRRVVKDAIIVIRKSNMPLLASIVNFYPAFGVGLPVCGLCAFAVRFLPMSVMRTGGSQRLWFLHTQELPLASAIARQYGWNHFNRQIAQNKTVDFFGEWETSGDSSTILYLLCKLLITFRKQISVIYSSPSPVNAYLFSNDIQRESYVRVLPIPNEILEFLAELQEESMDAFKRFWRELLQVSVNLNADDRKKRALLVQAVANRILHSSPIVGTSLDEATPKLLGGWIGHRLYLKEVQKMPESKLAILERLGVSIAQSEDANKRIEQLRKAHPNELYGILLRYVREGLLKHDEFYALMPPNDYRTGGEVRDILLAVAYEWRYCQSQGVEFPVMETIGELYSDETLQRIQVIGAQILQKLPNPSRWIAQLQTAQRHEGIRKAYLNAVRNGALRFDDFVFLAPLGERYRLWLLRDYLLAYLFDKARGQLPDEEEISTGEELHDVETFNGGGL